MLTTFAKFANSQNGIRKSSPFQPCSAASERADTMDMLSNALPSGLDLLARMAATAAERASAQLTGAIRLSECDRFELAEDVCGEDIAIETWAVATDPQAVIISVFASAPQVDGGRRMAGSGRFTFTKLPRKRRTRS